MTHLAAWLNAVRAAALITALVYGAASHLPGLLVVAR